MDEFNRYNPFVSAFTSMKMRYAEYDESLGTKDFLVPTDKINVFISLESVLKKISTIRDLDKLVLLDKDYPITIISEILNLIAHYKRFFEGNGLDTRVYVYQTDLKSEKFPENIYNEDFRCYYLVKYNDNPKYVSFTETFLDTIVPEVKTYCEFIPNVYFISSVNIEGSLIPLVVGKKEPERKNLIISDDMYDTQYDLMNNFEVHLVHRGSGYSKIVWNIPGFISIQTKKPNDYIKDTEVYDIFEGNYYFYVGLLSLLGSRIRSVSGISGFGPFTLKKLLLEGMAKKKIDDKTSNPEMIADIFDDEDLKSDFINNFLCTSYSHMYNNMSKSDEINITNQMVDRFDVSTLQALNRTRFYHHPIKLEWLISGV